MPTPVSGSPYCSIAQFLSRYDYRTVGQLLSDTDTPLTQAQVQSSALLSSLLGQASGKVETAAMLGGKYTPEELAGLTGNQAEWLAGIVADLTMPLVYRRRPNVTMPAMPQTEEAEAFLELLAKGERVLGIQENIDAGHMDSETETAEIVENRTAISYVANRLFGRRNNRLWD